MDSSFVQNLRYKLQKRVSRLNAVDRSRAFKSLLIQFWRFFDEQPTFMGIVEVLLAQFPDVEQQVELIFAGEHENIYGNSEQEAAALGYGVLRRLMHEEDEHIVLNLTLTYRLASRESDALDKIRDLFLEPFYEYVDEQLDDQRAMLALIMRYKHRSEWFYPDHLWKLSQAERKGEEKLAIDLYSYLYDQGIDFHIEPSSMSGEIDLITAQDTPDPLLLDTKIFDGEGRGKTYIRKGFNQIYTYTQQYGEAFGYLVIYKTTDRDLSFSLRLARQIPTIIHNHKTIFIITVDIYPHDKPVSQRARLQTTVISEEELIKTIEETADQSETAEE